MNRTTNIPFASIQVDIGKDLDENEQYIEKCQLLCVAVKREDRWQNYLTVVRSFPKSLMPESHQDRKYSYADALLIEKWMRPEEIISILTQIVKNTFVFDQEFIDFGLTNENWEKEKLPSDNDYIAYPGELYQIRSSRQVYYSGDFLLSYTSQYYPSIYDAK